MKTMLTLLVTAISSAIVLSASPGTAATAQIITDVAGQVHIQQSLPCDQFVDVTTDIENGRMEITPHIVRDEAFFDMTRLDMFLRPFSVEGSCKGIHTVADFTEIGVRLAGAVRFQGHAMPTDGTGLGLSLFRFVIPKESFLLFESVLDDLKIEHQGTAYQKPSEDVVGVVELMATERGIFIKRVQLQVVLGTKLRFRAGCLPGGRCRIDETHEGTQRAEIAAGILGPDTTPPTVACTRVGGGQFEVSASDEGGTPMILLGDYELANGEVFRLQQTGRPGVRMLRTSRPGAIRHFLVGRGENFVTATDPAGNVATAYCR